RTVAAATGAFCLYWPAILLPILQVERHGHRSESSVLVGTIDLISDGSWFIGGVIFLFSVILPLAKIVLLIELSLLNLLHRKHRSLSFRIMEYAGKWSMMDVMLLALLVMLVKIGNLVHFEFGPAVIAFVLCVVMSLLASMSFDPHSIWSEDE
ncbi:MAG: paraquat-inducible protein A, partial [Planctomycetaceae bacterium]